MELFVGPMKAFQDYYPDELATCFGCGRLNEHGHHLRSFWVGDVAEARFTPKEYHIAIPGWVNGGLIASLIDCHGTGTAAAAAYRAEGRELDTLPAHRFVTASLRVDYLRPTPLGPELLLRGHVRSVSGRKVIVDITVSVGDEITARGEVVAVEMPESMRAGVPPAPRTGETARS
jgi:acyl-coenzyme A thioesterase PaaI-like protein